MQHNLTKRLFDPTHPGNIAGEVQEFLDGKSRASLPSVKRMAGALNTIRTSERSIEGDMSIIGHVWDVAPHAGLAYVNNCLRFPEFEQSLIQNPEARAA